MRISGMLDYDAETLVALEQLQAEAFAVFGRYGYARVAPPILETADVFLERSGEEIRRRMYLLNDPGGREISMRPELTIPTCRLYLRSSPQPHAVTRLCYGGAVFRYESQSRGRYRQFHQVGVECFGAADAAAADAEIVSLAIEATAAAGVAGLDLKLGDLGLFFAFVDALPIPERWQSRLKRQFWRTRAFQEMLAALLSDDGGGSADVAHHPHHGAFLDALALLGRDRAMLVIEEVLSLAEISQVGGRTMHEIAARFLDRATDQPADAVPNEVVELIEAFLALEGPPADCLQRIEALARDAGIAIDDAIGGFQRRLRLMEAYGVALDGAVLATALRRSIEYYSGFIFELHDPVLGENSQICGGGRYDRLLKQLGSSIDIPAAGFAIGLERLLIAKDSTALGGPIALQAPVDAVVVAAGAVDERVCAEAARRLRQAGWRVRLELAGHRPRKVLREALREAIPYVVFVGEDEAKRGSVRIRDLAKREELEVELAGLGDYLARRTGGGAG